MPKGKKGTKGTPRPRLKVRKYRRVVTRFRGKRAKEREVVSRVYSYRPEEEAISPMVAYKPYETERLPSRESTAIYTAKYAPKQKLLTVIFWGYKQRSKGGTWVYYNVPYDVWVAFMEAGSKGRFFYYNIRTKYSYTRVG